MPSEASEVFVIWLAHGSAAAELPSYSGQVEHVPSGARASFRTAEELLRFIHRCIPDRAQRLAPDAERGLES